MAIYGAQPQLPLPEEMARRQSEQASVLQGAQAQMGGLSQAPPGGSQAGGQTFSGVMQQRRQQAEQLQARQADLQIAERMLQLLDPRLPRPARQFLFRELSRQVGVDPKGDQAKEIGAMVTALDPQTLEGLRRSMASRLQGSEPGQVVELARGILTGQVPITELMTPSAGEPSAGREGVVNLTSAGAEGASAVPATGGGPGASTPGSAPFPGMMRLGAGGIAGGLDQTGSQSSPVVPVQGPGAPGDTIGPRTGPPLTLPPQAAPVGAGPRSSESTTPPLQREVLPELAEVLGLDSTYRYRNIDVIRRGGFRRIPTNETDQRKMATDLRAMQDGVISSLLSGNMLHQLIEGRPDALNLSLGRIPFIGEVTLPNPSSSRVQVQEFVRSIGHALGLRDNRLGSDPEASENLLGTVRDLASRFGQAVNPSASVQDAATTNAQIQSLLINLAFSMAAAQGQTGRNLSDRDLELQLLALGRSANPEQFQAAIRTTMSRIYGQYLDRSTAQVGAVAPLAHAIPSEFIQTMADGPVTPAHLARQLTGVEPDPNRGRPIVIPPGSGTERAVLEPSPPDNTFGALRQEMLAATNQGRVTSPGVAQGPPAPGPVASRVPRTIVLGRQTPTLEQSEAEARQRAEEDRAGALAARAADARRLEISESQEARAARTEVRTVEEQRRQRIRDAFAQVAAAFRGSSRNAGISVGSARAGSDQDPNAFKLQPTPQRRAPQPVDASRFRRN